MSRHKLVDLITPALQRLLKLSNDYQAGTGWPTPWGTWFCDSDNSVFDVMPAGTPELRVRAAMKIAGKMGLVNGCHCGCRGDYEITQEGRAWLEKSA